MRFLSLLAALVAASPLAAQPPGPGPQPPRIVTSGEGEVKVTPDRATIFVGVQSRALTAAAASGDNARRQRAIIDTLKALGVPSDQIATQNFSVSPEMVYPQGGGSPKLTGYVVNNTVRVELKKIEQMGSVIDASIAKGSNQINSIQFSVADVATPRRAAIAEAVRNARADADALAAAAGGSVGQLIELSTAGRSGGPITYEAPAEMVRSAQAVPTPISPGQQTVAATVSATWTFVPKPPQG